MKGGEVYVSELFERIKQKAKELLKLDKRKKLKLKRMLPTLVITLAVVSLVIMTVYHSTDGFTTLVDVEYASIVSESDTMTFDAYMLRDEKVIDEKYPGGGVLYIASNGQRINPEDELARLYSNPVDKSVSAKADFLDSCIDILTKSIGDGSFTLGDSKEVRNGISELYYKITKAINTGNTSEISSNYDEFLVLLNRMESYSNNSDKLRELLSEYKAERKSLENMYSGTYTTLKADESGYFFRKTDGYENIFTSANIEDLTYEGFSEMLSAQPQTPHGIGKMLLNYEWFLAIPTVKGISDTYNVGQIYEVNFPDSNNRTLKMTLSNIVYDESGARSVMLFSCGVVDGEFELLRIQRVNILCRDISGYRIPEKAVCELNGTTGVYIIKDGMASFRKIVILYKGDGYYIVSADNSNSSDYYIYVELNDSIILDPKNMYEGKVIE